MFLAVGSLEFHRSMLPKGILFSGMLLLKLSDFQLLLMSSVAFSLRILKLLITDGVGGATNGAKFEQ